MAYTKTRQARWYQDNKKHCNAYYEQYREKIKLEVFKEYGGECLHCHEIDPIVLTIDHIFDDGHEDKKKGITGGFKLYQWLKRNSFPKDRFQLLCFNCNYRKEHKRRKDAFNHRQTI